MKKIFAVALLAAGIITSSQATAQANDKSKRPSPPAQATAKMANGATITIDYSQPSVKGRTIGKDLEPKDGQVWRTGANEATVFETDKDIWVMGEKLPAGKYGMFTLFEGSDVTVIFNKTWKQWGAFKYKPEEDVLRVKTKYTEASPAAEKFSITAVPGMVTILWGERKVEFSIK